VIHNVYNTTVINRTENRVSFNGGQGGVVARPTPEQETAMHERHIPPAAVQTQHVQEARSNRELRASVNQGKPPVAATARAGEFKTGAVAAREAGAPYHPPANRPEANRGGTPPREETRPENNSRPESNSRPENNGHPATAVHPRDLPPAERPTAPNTGNAKTDQKYQQQQQKLQQKQDQERQKLQQQQEKEHQSLDQHKANEASKQQTEQKHQQQTQQLQQRHAQQQQQLQHKQAPPPSHPEAKPPKEHS